jgi:hypothetical protein
MGLHDGIAYRVELEDKDGRTLLRVVRTGAPDADWPNTFDEEAEGWITFVGQLRFLIERSKGRPRRTLYLTGTANRPVLLPRSALGIPRNVNDFARTAQPEPLAGTVWHASKFQSGFSVSQWGGGLLVAMDRPVAEDRPKGGGALVLTTYELDDAAFEALTQRWTAWFMERYPSEPEPQADAEPKPESSTA